MKRGFAIAVMLSLFLLGTTACATSTPPKKRTDEGSALAPCPASPNCVSSIDRDRKHAIAPLVYPSDRNAAYRALIGIIDAQPRATIVKQGPAYVHVEFSSRLFGFIDDVEFLFVPDRPRIEIRSASRTGYFDFGVNRKRIEKIRRLLAAALD
jgi:uncharacterized protein (DUF1499 family)